MQLTDAQVKNQQWSISQITHTRMRQLQEAKLNDILEKRQTALEAHSRASKVSHLFKADLTALAGGLRATGVRFF